MSSRQNETIIFKYCDKKKKIQYSLIDYQVKSKIIAKCLSPFMPILVHP